MEAIEHQSMDAIRRRAEEISRGSEAGTPIENWVRAEQEHLVVHHYDTLDQDLARLGLKIARVPSEAGVVWRLRLPRGELVEAWEPGTAGLTPPPEIAELIGGVLDDKPLVPESAVLDRPGASRLRSALTAQLEALLTHDPGVRLGRDAENLHQHRVAARRTSAFVRGARAYLEPAWVRGLTELLKQLGGVTGPARDLDVLLEHAAPALASFDGPDSEGADELLRLLSARRAATQNAVAAMLTGDSYRLLLTRLRFPPRFRREVEDVPLEEIAGGEFRRLARSVRTLGPNPDAQSIHALRIALKRARYAAELAAPRDKAGRRFLDAAKTLQELLGEHQDAVAAEQQLRSIAVVDASTAAAFVAGRLAERQGARRDRVTEELPAAWRLLRRRRKKLAR